MAARLRDYRTRRDQGDGTFVESSHQGLLSKANQAINNAGASAGKWAGRAIGTALGGVGGFVGGRIGEFIGKNIARLGKAIAAFLVAEAVVGFILTLVGVVIFSVFAVFAMVVINMGAYVVTPGGPVPGPNGDGGSSASGSCPLGGSFRITAGSYDPQSETGHGGNNYWDIVEGQGRARCSYRIPTGGQYPNCYGPNASVPNSADNYCYNNAKGACPYYGYAVDVASDRSEVYLPTVCPEGETNCGDMTWTLETSWKEPGNGGGARFSSNDNGHSWLLVLLHIELTVSDKTGVDYKSGTQVAVTSPELGTNRHLHIELNMDGTPIKPDFICGGDSAATIPVDGWIVKVPSSKVGSLKASTPAQYSRQSCAWAQQENLKYAVNANFYESQKPVGPSGYNGGFTNTIPVKHSKAAFFTFVVDKGNHARIIGGSDDSGGYKFDSPLPSELNNLKQYKLAVTGVTPDSLAETLDKRTVIGIDGSGNVYFGAIPRSTPLGALGKIMSAGASQAFNLDGGGSTTFCEGGSTLFGGTRNVGNSIGTSAGDIINDTIGTGEPPTNPGNPGNPF